MRTSSRRCGVVSADTRDDSRGVAGLPPAPLWVDAGQGLQLAGGGEEGAADSDAYERLMLLELATDLENWPARNLVVREALDRAAQDLVAMAGKSAPTA